MSKEGYKEKVFALRDCAVNDYATDWLHKVKAYEMKVIFGGGELGKLWIAIWRYCNIKPDYICDNNKNYWGDEIEGLKCISPEDVSHLEKETVVFVTIKEYKPIYEQLIQMGIKAENIIIATPSVWSLKANDMLSKGKMQVADLCDAVCSVIDICEDELSAKICYQTLRNWMFHYDEVIDYTGKSYFIPEVEKKEQEVFVDAGAFNGDTLEIFLKEYNHCFKKYYAFEIDECNYNDICNKVSDLPDNIKKKIVVYNIGLWGEEKEICYGGNNSSARIESYGEYKAHVDRLDHILEAEKVTFIKMDIEGAEIEALKGCENIIHKHKPILAISIYHSVEEFIKIPLILKRFGYKIIIRHHDSSAHEIVCYAYC